MAWRDPIVGGIEDCFCFAVGNTSQHTDFETTLKGEV